MNQLEEKSFNQEDAKKKVSDVNIWGQDLFQLLCKASSKEQGWMKSTKAMEVGTGCVVQVSTQQKNPDGSYALAEAVCFVPGVSIYEIKDIEHQTMGRYLDLNTELVMQEA